MCYSVAMSIKFVTVDKPPAHTVEIGYLLVNDDCDYSRYINNTELLIGYIRQFDCFDMLVSHDATIYVHHGIEMDLDVFVIIMHCRVDSPQFTHYLLTRREISYAWIYLNDPALLAHASDTV